MVFSDLVEFGDWFAERRRAQKFDVTRIPLDDLDGWHADPETGDLGHHTGRFFTVEGLDVTSSGREVDAWQQPIINQAEQGVLGILVREFDGVPHCLLQAKMEPGNVNGLQLSPTVQATRSNFTGAHGGRPVDYLEHFLAPRTGRLIYDALQSEQASWFLSKRNRNMIVQVGAEPPLLDDFCWLSFDQISALMREPNLINMDTRSVLAGAVGPSLRGADPDPATFRGAVARSQSAETGARHTTEEVLSWFTEAKNRCTLRRRRIPLSQVSGWSRRDGILTHEHGQHFDVIGVAVQASSREVTSWHQPMFEPRSRGVIAFLVRRIGGLLHVLVQARVETGALDGVEIAPTVQCQPDSYRLMPGRAPMFLDAVLGAPPERVRFDGLLSEEGGRFHQAQNRYLVVEAGDDVPLDPPPTFAWITLRQLTEFVRYGNLLNVEARCLLTIFGFYQEDAP
ncbi:putative NDP-deoxyglucose-2,3-dehydratase [Actinoplanes missouriensis 431]|uniref:Putative NDP-deoxyglucose-2,3-dehydratase n=1 Tax=Actinoplanes missouriensis (strain ATCC 14538 / DSM 43046 / CBS 188.64 / JCM 3121 / NBRC 102363 / NCIMB 12654 / NRRL B-3342 / UNCC 431) TaxID=512565 RepID=I0HB91_ACTM4|nr:NDP-hexose 2,3-dehydratase family protein [Actinoplanes missouriensis]BAL90278.1 putative NDP-deoxyglucose-2,3-dehydratase [Actinoplanes missouriensis 431]